MKLEPLRHKLFCLKSSPNAPGQQVSVWEEVDLKKTSEWTSRRGREAPRGSSATSESRMKSCWSGACVEDGSAGSHYLSDANREGQLASITSKQATLQRFLWQENQIIKVDGDVRLLLLTRPSSVCYLSKCRVGWVPLTFQLINEKTLIITLVLFAAKHNPSINFLIIRVKGHWVRGRHLRMGQDTHFLLCAYRWDLLLPVMILKSWTTQSFLSKTSWKDFTIRPLLTLSDWCSISEHLFCWVVPAWCLPSW